jgi:vacuolar-type H+-ATPase subunit H
VYPEVIPLRQHLEALREADGRLHEAQRAGDALLFAERDQRYAEVKAAEEKALKVKEEADKTALGLQRETQTYKDEKANELREQINSERGLYATKDDLANVSREVAALVKPLADYVSGQQGRSGGAAETRSERRLDIGQIFQALSVIAALAVVIIALAHH